MTEVSKVIQLKGFSQKEAATLLFKCLDRTPANEDEQEAAERVSNVVGGLPFAIAAIGCYLQQSENSIPEYLDIMKRSASVWEVDAIGSAKRYGKSLQEIFDDALQELDEKARMFINVLAFFDPDGIPEDIFVAHFQEPLYKFARSKDE